MKITTLIATLALPVSALSAQVSYFDGEPGHRGNVVILGATEVRPPELQGVTLLPIDCTGRSRLDELVDGVTLRRTDVPGSGRLLLPMEQGSLYKFRRDSAGGAKFGYFVVGSDGAARGVFEIAGTGPGGAIDSLQCKVSVAATGQSFLAASTLEAGGDLWEVELATGQAVNRTPDLAPLSFKKTGLLLLDGFGVGVSERGVVRFDRTVGAKGSLVQMPVNYHWYGPDAVKSADESTVAFLAGGGPSSVYVVTCHQSGAAFQVSAKPMTIPGAGFLPEVTTGPWLALSTDGSRVAWRAEGATAECFVHAVPGAPTDLQVTSDERFDYTLNETGVIAFVGKDAFVALVGRGDGTTISRADFYRVEHQPANTVVVSNLTGTSGITKAPFDYGYLSSTDRLQRVPGTGASAFLLHQTLPTAYGMRGRLLWVEDATGPTLFMDRVQTVDSIEVVGNHLVANVHRSAGVDYPFEESINLLQIPKGGVGTVPVLMPHGCKLSRESASRSGGQYAAIFEFDVGEWLGRIEVPSTTGFTLSPTLANYGPTTAMTANGDVIASVTRYGTQLTLSWSDLGVQILRRSGQGFVLPGS